jgi:hypothetical protein
MQSDMSNNVVEPAKTACGGKLKNTDDYASAIYVSEQIYFCTQARFRVFTEYPDDFMAGKIEHPLDND